MEGLKADAYKSCDWRIGDVYCRAKNEEIWRLRECLAALEAENARLRKEAIAARHETIEARMEVDRLRTDFEAYRIAEHERHYTWRGLTYDDLCQGCHGAGVRAYGSTATWRGGIGGQSITNDVCNACWGSGSASCKWPSHSLARPGASEAPSEAKEGE